jgi:hypothetical protein
MSFSCRFRILALLLTLISLPALSSDAQRFAIPLASVSPRPETIRVFDKYVSKTDANNAKSLIGGNFLWIDDLDQSAKEAAYAKLKRGEVVMQRIIPAGDFADVPGGMIHDWEGMVFIPGAKLQDVLTFLQDYDRQSTYFAPDVQKSRIEEHSGNHFRVFLRFRRSKIITVVLNTDHEVNYFSDSPTRAHSRSSAIRIAEVDNPGEPSEKEKAPGQDNGFLWRMETWWRMVEKDGGVYLQNQVVSLSRDIPTGLGWAVEPFVTSIPKGSLEFTLGAVRRSVLAKSKTGEAHLTSPILVFERQSGSVLPQ